MTDEEIIDKLMEIDESDHDMEHGDSVHLEDILYDRPEWEPMTAKQRKIALELIDKYPV